MCLKTTLEKDIYEKKLFAIITVVKRVKTKFLIKLTFNFFFIFKSFIEMLQPQSTLLSYFAKVSWRHGFEPTTRESLEHLYSSLCLSTLCRLRQLPLLGTFQKRIARYRTNFQAVE